MDPFYEFYESIKKAKYKPTSPKAYAEKLKELFFNNDALWYERISPASKADELKKATNGDYSEIWDDHCQICFKPIDKNTTEIFYLSEDELTWVCESCFKKMQEE